MSIQKHHLLFDRATWRSADVRKDIRENHWLIPPLSIDAHRELHRTVAVVPALDWYTAARVRRDFEPQPGDYLGSAEILQAVIEESLKHPKTTELQRDLGMLTIQAIEMQKPFLEVKRG